MKKILFLLVSFFCPSILFSQDTISTSSIGLAISYQLQHNTSNNTEKNITPATTIGIEYAEHKPLYGYQAGIYYTQLNNLDILPYLDYVGDGSPAGPQPIYPSLATLRTFDFLLAGRIFYYSEDEVKLYAHAGLMNSFNVYNNKDYVFFFSRYETANHSLTLRTIIGLGVLIRLREHIGMDISASRKILLHAFDEHFIRPFDSFNFQMKLEYFF